MASSEDVQTQAALMANKLASAAVGFAIAAFLMAYLQLFLGNITSGNALWKTNQAAIGVLAFHRSWRPSFRRIKILYPQISFQPERLLQAAHASKEDRRSSSHLRWLWRWLISEPEYFHDRPRATWAQIVQAFGIVDASCLVEDYLDSDTVPSGIDVPVQRASLFDLGRLALYLGCDTVDLDVEARELHAQGEICSMTTDLLPTFGKAVRFEGDISTLTHMSIGSHRLDTAMIMNAMCLGYFVLGVPTKAIEVFWIHPHILHRCLMQESTIAEYHADCQLLWPNRSVKLECVAGSFADEAEVLSSCRNLEFSLLNHHREDHSLADWQRRVGFKRSSIMLITTHCVIPGAFIGYPRGLFINDMVKWCCREASQLFGELDGMMSSSFQVLEILEQQALSSKVFLYHDQVRMPFLGKKPAYSWLTTPLQEEYNGLPASVKDILSSSTPHLRLASDVQVLILPWTMALLEDYNPSEWAKRFRRRCQGTLKPYRSLGRLLWMQLVLLDISIRLQIKRDPKRLDGGLGSTGELQDLEIEKPVSSIMIAEGPEIVHALVESQINSGRNPLVDGSSISLPLTRQIRKHGTKAKRMKKKSDSKYQPWDLHGSLVNRCSFYKDMSIYDASCEYNRLAIMLKLRVLLFIAFLSVGPDSSQVYEARNSQAQVPII